MIYTIAQAAKKTGLTAHTLRYYDKEGLLPFVDRSPSGNRVFKDSDFEWLSIISWLKSSGMPIKNIKTFIDWCLEGDSSLEKRLNVFVEQKKIAEEKMAELENHLKTIDHKIWYYKTALAAGTEAIHAKNSCVAALNITPGNTPKH